jgi:hypothetical protein
MAWFKVDDRLHSSRKILSIPRSVRLSAVGLWTLAGSWSAHEELDGLVPDYMVTELGGTPRLVSALITAGLWVEVAEGSKFNKWQEYQPVRVDLELARAKETERKRQYRARGTTAGVPAGQTEGHHPESGHPDPTRPDPTITTSNEVVKERPATRGSRLSPSWMPSDQSKAKAREDAPSVDHQAEHSMFIDYWIAQPGQKGVKTDWDATWRNWMRRKQSDLKGARQTPEQKARKTLALATDIDMKEIEQ